MPATLDAATVISRGVGYETRSTARTSTSVKLEAGPRMSYSLPSNVRMCCRLTT